MIGQTFNFLTVIEGPFFDTSSGRKRTLWRCKCRCGTEKLVRQDGLKSGRTKSCGCYKRQVLIDANKKRQTLDLTGQIFGLLTALEPTEERKDNRVVWKCQCECGNITFADTHSLQQGKIKSCGCLGASFGEHKIAKMLTEAGIVFEQQKTFNNCRFEESNYLARFDFYIDNKYIIEYDGEQHYWCTKHGWNTIETFQDTQKRDAFKNNWCKENNIPLIRIPYTHLKELKIEDLILETSKFII